MHKHFWHPSVHKIYDVLQTTNPHNTGETLKELKEIPSICRTFAVYGKGPQRFEATLPKGVCIFKHELAMDLVLLKGKPALRVVDKQTHFSAAMFLQGRTVQDI